MHFTLSRFALLCAATVLFGCGGTSDSAGSTTTPPPSVPVISSFTATPSSIIVGGSSTLAWTVAGATSLSISQGVGAVTGSSVSVSPIATTTYTLTASNSAGTVTASTTVTVSSATVPVATVTVILASSTLYAGQTTQATATVRDADGNILVGRIVTWSSTPSAGVDQTGLVTAGYPGVPLITATCEGRTGSAALTVLAITVAPMISSFTATPSTITSGGSSTMTWSVTGATSLSINQGVGAVTGTNASVSPTTTTTYTLTATNSAGTVTANTTVTVSNPTAPAISSFTATPSTISSGGSSTLSWSVTGATSLLINQGVGAVTGTNASVSPTTTTTYTLTATNSAGSVTANATVTIQEARKLNVPYVARNGMTVTLTNFTKVDSGTYYTYTASYTQTNNTTGRLDEGFLKLYFSNRDGMPQYGFFNSLMPGQSTTRSYSFQVLYTETPTVLEYDQDNFFSTSPVAGSLQWLVSDLLAVVLPGDRDAPQLVSLSFSPATVALNGSSGTTTVTAEITDVGTGVAEGGFGVVLRGPTGVYVQTTGATLVGGTANSGTWTATATFPVGSASGAWELIQWVSQDGAGNQASLTGAYLAAYSGGVVVTNANADNQAPQLVSLSFSPATVALNGSSGTTTVTAEITDVGTGVAEGGFGVVLRGPTGVYVQTTGATLVGGTANSGTWTATATFPVGSASGAWELIQWVSQDGAGNQASLTGAYLAAYSGGVVVTNANADNQAPQLVSLSFSPATVALNGSSGTTTVTAEITDVGTGVAEGGFGVVLRGPTGVYVQTTGATLVGGTANSGTWTATATFPVGSASGAWELIQWVSQDGAGNQASLTGAYLAAYSGGVVVVADPSYSASISPTSLNFGSVNIGSRSTEQSFQIMNTGTGPLTVSVGVNGPYFISTPCSAVLAAGMSCTVGVIFEPTLAGGTMGNAATVRFSELAGWTNVFLSGTGLPTNGYSHSASISPTSLDFGSVDIGSRSTEQTFQIMNTGTGALTVSVGVNGPYFISTPCSAVLAAGMSCTVGVIFEPTLAGGTMGNAATVRFSELAGWTNVFLSGTGI